MKACGKTGRVRHPASEIEFIQYHDGAAAKLQLFRGVRAGKVRMLFGITQKMGTGANVQEHLIALHRLDAPWRPADVEHREGRILRPGNTNTDFQFGANLWLSPEPREPNWSSALRRLQDESLRFRQ